jgi:hypothetical protein
MATQKTLKIVGNYFRSMNCREALTNAEDQAPIQLRRDFENPYDTNAVAVDLDGKHVGFIPAVEAVEVAALMLIAEVEKIDGVLNQGKAPTVTFTLPEVE